jgi:nucleoid-associated protein YgaU
MSSSSVRRQRGAGRVLWGRMGVALAALLMAFGVGRCSIDEGVAVAEHQAAQVRISELEQLTRDLEQNQVALAAGGIDTTPSPQAEADGEAEPEPEDDAEPEATPTEAATGEGSEYTVAEGDTLESIAERVYGDRTLFTRIAEANGVDSTQLQVGQTLRIPPAEDAE